MKLAHLSFLVGLLLAAAMGHAQAHLKSEVVPLSGKAPLGYVEIRGVAARSFDPVLRKKGKGGAQFGLGLIAGSAGGSPEVSGEEFDSPEVFS